MRLETLSGIQTRSGINLLLNSRRDRSRAAFLLECELPPGLYFVTVALSEPRRLGFHEHWLDRAEMFQVTGSPAESPVRVHFVRATDYWSSRVSESGNSEPPWRNAVARGTDKSSPDLRPGTAQVGGRSILCREVGASPKGKSSPIFRPQGFFDVHARISSPRVWLQLMSDRVEVLANQWWLLRVELTNLGDETLSPRYEYPVKPSYHWMAEDQTIVVWDGLRSNLNFDVLPGDTCEMGFVIQPPPNEQCQLLCLTLVQELVCWFDDRDPENRLLVRVQGTRVAAAHLSAEQVADVPM